MKGPSMFPMPMLPGAIPNMMMPMPGAMEMQMQMAQWQEMQWRQMQQDASGDDSLWESFSPVSWGMSPMMVPMEGEDVSDVVGDESFEAARSPKVALDLSTSLAQQQNCKMAEDTKGPGAGKLSPRVVNIAQMLCV